VCEVVSYCRWVVEAKKPSVQLSQDDSYQAHTYATHPEIAAEFYMLTNGREFRLYRVGEPDKILLAWAAEQTDDMLPVLKSNLGPDAMKRRADVKIDLGKPLAEGLGSKLEIISGHVVYEKNTATVPLDKSIDGLTNAITGRVVERLDNGLISATVDVKSAISELQAIHDAIGFSSLVFNTADEFISKDSNSPTLMQNVMATKLAAGTIMPKSLLSPGGVVPFDFEVELYIEAVGFIEGKYFKGTFFIDYDYKIIAPPHIPLPFDKFQMKSEGPFEIRFQ